MEHCSDTQTVAALETFVGFVGKRLWKERMAFLERGATPTLAGRALLRRHAVERVIERFRRGGGLQREADRHVLHLAVLASRLIAQLTIPGRARYAAGLRAALSGDGVLIGLFHLVATADRQRQLGFEISYAGLDDGAPYDLLLTRDGLEAEIVCDVISAEKGRDLHRYAWIQLVDRVDPDLQLWLAQHPGRYLLKMTLPNGLRADRDPAEPCVLASLHRRINALLAERRRACHDQAAVLRLDPLVLAATRDEAPDLLGRLRREFGPEAHLAVTAGRGSVFVMAARAAREDEIAQAVHRHMAAIAPTRLTGTRPGILAMFLEDLDRADWRLLCERLELEGEARQFLTRPEARSVVAITCTSRRQLFAAPSEDCGLRFRNQAHPAAKLPALAAAVLSTV